MRKHALLMLVAAALLAASSCLHSPEEIAESSELIPEFIGIWMAFQSDCVLFDYKGINWVEVGSDFYDMFEACESREQFYDNLGEMLFMIGSTAAGFETFEGEPLAWPSPEDWVYPWIPEYTSNSDLDMLVENYLDQYGFETCTLGVGICDPELLPYINLSRSVGGTALLNVISSFVTQCNSLGLDAVIVDLRHASDRMNGSSDQIAGFFTDKTYTTYISRTRNGPEYSNYFDNPQAVHSYGAQQFTGTVIVLTGRQIDGGMEWLSADFSFNENALLVGDTTMGCPDFSVLFSSETFIHARIPTTTIVFRDGTWIHGNGIPPDIYVETTPGDLASGIDPVFEYALELLAGYR